MRVTGCARSVCLEVRPRPWQAGLSGRPIQTGVDVVGPTTTRPKCASCGGGVPETVSPLQCTGCKRSWHKRCSGMTRAQMDMNTTSGTWKCEACTPGPIVTPASQGGSEKKCGFTKRKALRILQWNCNGLRTSSVELASLLERWQADVALVQESKLRAGEKTPVFQ